MGVDDDVDIVVVEARRSHVVEKPGVEVIQRRHMGPLAVVPGSGVHDDGQPTSDPLAGTDWYVQVFGFSALLMEESENEVAAVLCNIRAVSVCCCGAPPRRSLLCADSRCSV